MCFIISYYFRTSYKYTLISCVYPISVTVTLKPKTMAGYFKHSL